jgi:hypothetical protein
MGRRIAGTCALALLLAAAFATSAGAQQVSPGGGNAQVSQYVAPFEEQPPAPEAAVPGIGGVEGAEPGPAGELAFTGLMLLALIMLAVLLVFGGLALRRRAAVPATS